MTCQKRVTSPGWFTFYPIHGQRESGNVEALTGGFLGVVDGTGGGAQQPGTMTPEQIMRAMPRHWPARR